MKTTYAPFDAAQYLDNDAVIAEYLAAAAEDPNPGVFLAALGDVAKARGMAEIAREAGLGRESLYKALDAGAHPRYETVNAVLRALGVKLTVAAGPATSHDRKRGNGLSENAPPFQGEIAASKRRKSLSKNNLDRLTMDHLERLYKPIGEIIVQWALIDTSLHYLAFAMFKATGTTPEKERWPVMFGARLEVIEKVFAKKPEFKGLASAAKPVFKSIKNLQILRDMLVHGSAVRYEPTSDAVLWERIDRSTKKQRRRDPAISHMLNNLLVRYSMLAVAAEDCVAVNAALLTLCGKVKAIEPVVLGMNGVQ